MDINAVTLLGNVGKDPDIKTLDSGDMMARFTLATSFKYKDNEYTEWHNIVCFNSRLAEIIQKYVVKGTRLIIRNAQIRTRKYQQDGVDKYITEVVMPKFNGELILISRTSETSQEPPSAGSSQPATSQADDAWIDDEIPF